MNTIICGDVIEHTNSHRQGCVIEVGRTHRDGTTEYHVRPARDDKFGHSPTWWNSVHVRRVARRDPYRRYLALIAAEDDPGRQARRQLPPGVSRRRWARRGGTFGPYLSNKVWDALFWRLCNQHQLDPSGAYVHYDLGRAAWEKASIDCLERRERAARWWFLKCDFLKCDHSSGHLTREEFDTLQPDSPLEFLYGQEWRPARVLGHVGTRLHVGLLTGDQVVGYILSWSEAHNGLRFPSVTRDQQGHT